MARADDRPREVRRQQTDEGDLTDEVMAQAGLDLSAVDAVAYTRGGHWLLLWGAIVAIVVAWIIIRTGILSGIRDRMERRRKRPKLVSLVVGVVYLLMSAVLLGLMAFVWWAPLPELQLEANTDDDSSNWRSVFPAISRG